MASIPQQLGFNKIDFGSFVSNKTITKGLVSYFYEIIREISDCPRELINDCAVICAFLQSKEVFASFYERVVDPELKKMYEAQMQKKKEGDNVWLLDGGALMHSFYELMKSEGFAKLEGVVFTGKAVGFSDVVGNRILFRDCTGLLHGEYTHCLQWLTVCYLKKLNCCCVEGGYQFQNSISDIYSKIAAIPIFTIKPDMVFTKYGLEFDRQTSSSWPGELKFTSKQEGKWEGKTLWDFMVDCFSSVDMNDQPMAREDHDANLYTDSYRCPANISVALEHGCFQNLFIGQLWKNRLKRYVKDTKAKRDYPYTNKVREFVEVRQVEKGRELTNQNQYGAPKNNK